MSEHDVVDREEIAVQFISVRDGLEHIRAAWDELEAVVGSLRGRRFWGAFYAERDEYRACVELPEGAEPFASLATGTLPGGRYARIRLHGAPPAVYERIGPAFAQLLQTVQHDASRPGLEHYRRIDEIDVLLPIE